MCVSLLVHDQVEFQTGAQDRSYAEMRAQWAAARATNVPGDAHADPVSLPLPPIEEYERQLLELHALFDQDKDGLLNKEELNAHLMAASNRTKAPLSESLFTAMVERAESALRPERDRLVLTLHRALNSEQAALFMSHPPAERGGLLRAMRSGERESLYNVLQSTSLLANHRGMAIEDYERKGVTPAGLGTIYGHWSEEGNARRVVPRLHALLVLAVPKDDTESYGRHVAVLCGSVEGHDKEKELAAEAAYCSDHASYKAGPTMGEPSVKIGAMHTARGESLLSWACKEGEIDFVRELVGRYGCRVNRLDQRGKSALHKAAEAGHVGVIRCLMEKRADPSLTDRAGLNVMQSAMLCHQTEAVRVLLAEFQATVATGDDLKLGLARPAHEKHLF